MEHYGQFVDIEKICIDDAYFDNNDKKFDKINDKKFENCINEYTILKIVSNGIISIISTFFKS